MNKRIRISERQLHDIITESVRKVLCHTLVESQESKSISAAVRYLMGNNNWTKERATDYVRNHVRNSVPVTRYERGAKFILACTRILNDTNSPAYATSVLNNVIRYLVQNNMDGEYDRDLNGMDEDDLGCEFDEQIRQTKVKEREELYQNSFGDTSSDYEIIEIQSFYHARQYAKYNEWCICHDRGMFYNYIDNCDGRCFFLLRKGFENEPKVKGEGCPLDGYGLSMIYVLIDEDGHMEACACRWNHDNGGSDYVMNIQQLSNVVGCNIYELIKQAKHDNRYDLNDDNYDLDY